MITIPKDESLPLPPSETVETPPTTTPVQTPAKKPTFGRVASALADSVQQGLSYANARRARETYRG